MTRIPTIARFISLGLLLLASPVWAKNPVTLAVGPNGNNYGAPVFSVACEDSYSPTSWVVLSVDGQVVLDADVPMAAYSWAPSAGQHTIQCQGKHWDASNPRVVDGTVTQTIVTGAATPSPSPTPLVPSPQPTVNPPVNPPISTGCNVTGNAQYVSSSSGDDAKGDGSRAHPWKTLTKALANPPAVLLFKGGDIFNVEWDIATSNICISSYGGSRAIFDGQSKLKWAIGEVSGNNDTPPADHVTVDNLEIRHYTEMGLAFVNHNGGASGQLKQITVSNNLIYDVGPGCEAEDGPCLGYDPGGYLNAITIEDDRVPTQKHLWQVVNNTVKWVGGHNAIQVHFDAGPTIVKGNTVGPGCVHGCIDVKGSGSVSGHAVISDNTAGCGLSQGGCGNTQQSAAFYTENPYNTAGSVIDYLSNVAQDSPVGFQACAGGCSTGSDCPLTVSYDNNRVTGATQWALYLDQCGTPSTAHVNLGNNLWGGGRIRNGF